MKTTARLPRAGRSLAAALLAFALLPGPSALGQDAMGDRYRDIRAPVEALTSRIARQRLQSELRALDREEVRVRSRSLATRSLRYDMPDSALAVADRALQARLDRIRVGRRQAEERLAALSREPVRAPAPVTGLGAVAPNPVGVAEGFQVSSPEAVAAARDFVDALLRSNRSRTRQGPGSADPGPSE